MKRGKRMKKNMFTLILLCTTTIVFTVGCGNTSGTSEIQGDDLESYIDEISLFGLEDGCAYWDVYFSDDVKWGEDDSLMDNLALFSIKQCIEKEESQNAVSWSIMGYESDGHIAFSWGGIDGIDEIRYYEDSVYTYSYSLTSSQFEYVGLETESDSNVTSDASGSNENNNISISENNNGEDAETVKSKLDIKAIPTSDGLMCVFITNNSKTIIDELEVQLNYKDESGTTIDTDNDRHDMILPGSTVVSRLDVPDSYSEYDIVSSIELGVNPTYENHAKDIQINSNQGEKCVIIEITNNSDVSIDEIEYIVVLYKDNQLVTVEYPKDVRDVPSGQTITEKVDTYNTDYDSFEVYLNQAHTFGL